ncbi:homeobox protein LUMINIDEPENDENS [Oryza brachyantha]|uniref:Homeobox domain-containing protein n=1 Tax=Oryza brachyantha TaxID=4533 RepID=J3L7K0_ORYBR|nr:homeobox protein LUMINIDEPENDENS [Oryza brachyantha]
MELVPLKPAAGALVESSGGGAAFGDSIPATVAAQQEMLHAQVDQLRRLVVAQCRLTGVNPLAQEMAAGALCIKIGKRPRDLLNPKAVKSMQSLFAVKDTIGKKETREISASCGVTVTQVREFFASQRTQVRKFVRLSREKALRLQSSKAPDNLCYISSEQAPVDIEAHAQVIEPLRTLEPLDVQQSSLQHVMVPQISSQLPVVPPSYAIPVAPTDIMQVTVQLTDAKTNSDSIQKETKQDGVSTGVESEDKKFLESIFALMRKENTFSGQVKLMESILQINNVTVLSWFLTMGGLAIVSTWLGEAVNEEQTTVILVIFKLLLHLPLHKALPAHMSTVLQTINRLRFYRTQDISSKARNLLSRLSKVLVRSQALKKSQKNLICKQRINEILRDESWKSEVGITEGILALTEDASESRMPEAKKTPLLLTASADESNKKSSLQTKSKERRKVLLVEHPNRKAVGKNVNPARSTSTNSSRPLSADDIQKAKMRAMFMQEKYGKVDTSKVTDKPHTMEIQKSSGLVDSNAPLVPRSPLTSIIKQSVDPSPSTSKQSILSPPDKPEVPVSSKLNIATQENIIEKFDSKRVLWQIPPDVWIDPAWSLGTGENSKEFEVQTQRNRREKETFYTSLKDIPLNPKDPWDVEMDFDDSLTPEIPIDQPPDADAMETNSVGTAPPNIEVPVADKQVGSTSLISPVVAAGANGAASEPDLELLAVLLKNPQLVFALTSNQGGTLPSEQTVALLDMLKQTGLGLSELVNGLANNSGVQKEPESGPETIPTSLPSPTPPKDLAARDGWRSEFPSQMRTSNLQRTHLPNRANVPPIASTVQQSFSNVVSSLPSQPYASASALPAQIQTNILALAQSSISVNPSTQHVAPMNNLLSRATVHQHTQSYALASDPIAVAVHQQPAVNKLAHEVQNISHPSTTHSSVPEPHASHTSHTWQPSAATVATTGRNATPDRWSTRTTSAFNVAPSNPVTYPKQNAYSNHSTKGTTYNAYGSTPVTSHSLLPGQGRDRNGYTHTTEYQTTARDALRRNSRSPELGAGAVYGGSQSYVPEPSRQWSYGQQSYNPEPSRQWSSGQQSYNSAEPSRQWSSQQQQQQQGYNNPAEPSRQWSSSQQQGYNPEPSRLWNSGRQSQNPEAPRQWNQHGKQERYNPTDGRNSYDQRWRR